MSSSGVFGSLLLPIIVLGFAAKRKTAAQRGFHVWGRGVIRAQRIWRLQRVSGTLAMIMLVLTLLILFDGLRGGIFGGSGQVRLVPGERYVVSGPMPPKTERIEDFVIEGGAFDGSLRLVPEAVFTGYLFGGGMWRGYFEVNPVPRPGTYVFKVRDRFGEKQNPALVLYRPRLRQRQGQTGRFPPPS